MAEAVQDKNSLYCGVKVLVFSPLPYHICGGVCRGQIHRTLGSKSWKCAVRCRCAKNV